MTSGAPFPEWRLVLSTDMPQQGPGTNACGLFTTVGSDMLSSGGDLSMIDKEMLERNGRVNMAAVIVAKVSEDPSWITSTVHVESV